MRNQADNDQAENRFDPRAARRRRYQAAMLSREIHRIAREAGVPAKPQAPDRRCDQDHPGS